MSSLKRISLLSDNVKKKIAAGEVIEGPFSVIKELIENSIDADADSIEVKVNDAGMKKISVKDNGRGIHPDDIELAVAEHATSKIKNTEDIESILSYGFRGEALSSLSAVSKLTILSKIKNIETGAKLESDPEKTRTTSYAGPEGTTVIVENLFYCVPARKKFLKGERAEMRRLRETFLKTALANPRISFTLDANDKRLVTLPRCDSVNERIEMIYGKESASRLIKASLTDVKVKITGWFSKPGYMKASRSMQAVFINGRPVDYPYLSFHLTRAYEGIITKGEYPAGIVFVDIEPSLVDVNVHPAKREIKLFDRSYIDSLIYQSAKKAIEIADSSSGTGLFPLSGKKNMTFAEDETATEDQSPLNFPENRGQSTTPSPRGQSLFLRPIDTGTDASRFARETSHIYNELSSDISICGIAFGLYIIAEKNDILYLIDMHAAHERMIYDSIMAENRESDTQELMFPKVLELSPSEHSEIIDNIEYFQNCGFSIEDFADNSVIIRGVPVLAGKADPEDIIKSFFEEDPAENDAAVRVLGRIAAATACRSARKSGDHISRQEIFSLTLWALNDAVERRCPHGRPFVRELKKTEIERMFSRS